MLEINYWFFVQLANVLLLLIVLNLILFRPFLKLFSERHDNTKGALESAKAMDEEKDAAMAEINTRLFNTRNMAKTVFEDMRRQGQEIQKKIIESAQNASVEINRKTREELQAATLKAREKIKPDIETFSDLIVEKLAGK